MVHMVHMRDFSFAVTKAGGIHSSIISYKILGARAKFLDTLATLHVGFVHTCVVIHLLLVLAVFIIGFPDFQYGFDILLQV
jgi:hypothetical protein